MVAQQWRMQHHQILSSIHEPYFGAYWALCSA